jgi:hypothetical protein
MAICRPAFLHPPCDVDDDMDLSIPSAPGYDSRRGGGWDVGAAAAAAVAAVIHVGCCRVVAAL